MRGQSEFYLEDDDGEETEVVAHWSISRGGGRGCYDEAPELEVECVRTVAFGRVYEWEPDAVSALLPDMLEELYIRAAQDDLDAYEYAQDRRADEMRDRAVFG